MSDLTVDQRLHPEDLAEIIKTVRVASPWLSAKEAAEYLRCPLSRIRKLTSTGDLPHEHEGGRVLYHRDRLDEFILEGGAISP
jgi:excisionase family DNA binding protein